METGDVEQDRRPVRLEISVNGKVTAVAGVGTLGVVHAEVMWISDVGKKNPSKFTRYELTVGASGLDSVNDERPEWLDRRLKIGDVVKIRVLRNVPPSPPRHVQPPWTPEQTAHMHLSSLVAGLLDRERQNPDLLLTSYDGEFMTTVYVLKEVRDSGSEIFDGIAPIHAPISVRDLLEITVQMQNATGAWMQERTVDDGEGA